MDHRVAEHEQSNIAEVCRALPTPVNAATRIREYSRAAASIEGGLYSSCLSRRSVYKKVVNRVFCLVSTVEYETML